MLPNNLAEEYLYQLTAIANTADGETVVSTDFQDGDFVLTTTSPDSSQDGVTYQRYYYVDSDTKTLDAWVQDTNVVFYSPEGETVTLYGAFKNGEPTKKLETVDLMKDNVTVYAVITKK